MLCVGVFLYVEATWRGTWTCTDETFDNLFSFVSEQGQCDITEKFTTIQ